MLAVTHVPLIDLRKHYATVKAEIGTAIDRVLEEVTLFGTSNRRAFEIEFAAYCRTSHALGVGSGKHALYLALRACGIRPGDEVIVPAFGMATAVEAVLLTGAVPVYVDVEPRYLTLSPCAVDAAVTARTRAVLPVHLFGQMADLTALREVIDRHGLVLIEDARQAVGADLRGQRAGSNGDAAAFSFSLSRNMHGYGDAGAVTTSSRSVALEIGMSRGEDGVSNTDFRELSISSRLDEIQAAILRVELPRVDEWNAMRINHARMYEELLEDTPLKLPEVRPGSTHVFNQYTVQVQDRDVVRKALSDLGVETGLPCGVPLYRKVTLRGHGRVQGDTKVAEAAAASALSLPMFPELEADEIAYVVNCLRACRFI